MTLPLDNSLLLWVILFALLFDFLNGIHDSSNIVATVISSRALSPRLTLFLAAIAHMAGPFLFGVAVATTIGNELLEPELLSLSAILAALLAAIVWNLATWYLGIPASSSHALLGGLLGSAIIEFGGLGIIKLTGLVKILIALFASPVFGLLVGFLLMRATLFALRKASPSINTWLRRLQVITLTALGLSHGTNDAQKTMGIITLALLITGNLDQFRVPLWVVGVSALAIALGTSFGGWRLIRTLGGKLFQVRPIHGLTSQLAGAAVILVAAVLGGPVSTTQVMSSSIMGVGAGERLNQVRWSLLGDMIRAWLLTLPVTALLSAGIFALIRYLS
jgi:PiT family inorganic phosphate transporter